jgi:hypothetical protein
MSNPLVWFGEFEFGHFVKEGAYGMEKFPCAIIHSIDDQQYMTELEADDYMVKHSYAGYLISSQFKGEVYYSEGAKDHD